MEQSEQQEQPIINEFPPINQDNAEKDKAAILNIVFFETLGTILLIYGALATQNNFGVALVYFISLLLFGRLSGGHFNPICTLIGFIDGSVSRKKAIYYVGSQLVAGLLSGMLLMPLFANQKHLPYYEALPTSQVFATLMAEIAGSIIFFTFIQIQIAENTKITTTQVQSAIFISVIFFVARQYTATMDNSLFNPAAAIGLELFYGIYYGKWNQLVNLLIYIMGPWIGSLLGITFYWKVYIPTLVSKPSN